MGSVAPPLGDRFQEDGLAATVSAVHDTDQSTVVVQIEERQVVAATERHAGIEVNYPLSGVPETVNGIGREESQTRQGKTRPALLPEEHLTGVVDFRHPGGSASQSCQFPGPCVRVPEFHVNLVPDPSGKTHDSAAIVDVEGAAESWS